jgi:hypothetical protein
MVRINCDTDTYFVRVAVGTSWPQEQQTDVFDAADISSSYLPIEIRICEAEISGGNAWEAAARRGVGRKSKDIKG